MNRPLMMLGGFVLIIIVLFSNFSVSTGTDDKSRPSYNNSNVNKRNSNSINLVDNQIIMSNNNESKKSERASDYLKKQLLEGGLPKADEYMSQTLKEQINNMESKFYYDNCRYRIA